MNRFLKALMLSIVLAVGFGNAAQAAKPETVLDISGLSEEQQLAVR